MKTLAFFGIVVSILGLGLSPQLFSNGYSSNLYILNTTNEVQKKAAEAKAMSLYQFAQCGIWEGGGYRSCNITITRVTEGHTGSLAISNIMNLNISWWDR